MKITVTSHAAFIEQLFRPFAQGTTEPFRDRQRKSLLRAVHQLRWNVLIEQPAEYPFAAAIAKFHGHWQAGRKLYNAVIQKWHATFQAHGHSCAVEFDEDIVRKISRRIEKHHLHAEITEFGPCTALA